MNDIAAAYQCALRYHISGDTNYANEAVSILNAWGQHPDGECERRFQRGYLASGFVCGMSLPVRRN